MQIYLGTYSGQLLVIDDFPNSLKLKKALQISQSSVRSILRVQNNILFATYGQELKVYSSITYNEILDQKDDQGGKVTFLKAKDQRHTILGMQNGSIKLFDLKSYTVVKQQRAHKNAIQDIIIDSDSKLMVTASKDKLCFWAIQDFKKVYQYKLAFNIQGVLATDDFSSLFLIGEKQVRQFSTQNNTQVAKLQVDSAMGQIQSHLLYEEHLILGTTNGYVLIWKKGQYGHFIKFKAHSTRVKISKAVDVEDLAYLITGSSDGQLKVWDVLQFVKEVEKISEDYYLEGLKPLLQINLSQRLLCIDVQNQSQSDIELKQEKTKKHSIQKSQVQKTADIQKEEAPSKRKEKAGNIEKVKRHKNNQQKRQANEKKKNSTHSNQQQKPSKHAEYLDKVKKIQKFKEKEKRNVKTSNKRRE